MSYRISDDGELNKIVEIIAKHAKEEEERVKASLKTWFEEKSFFDKLRVQMVLDYIYPPTSKGRNEMSGRFNYVKYDEKSIESQNQFKSVFEGLENMVSNLQDGRAKSLVMTKLEEAYLWVGKAIRDEQLAKRGGVEQPERKDG